jgi:hypothetical protein
MIGIRSLNEIQSFLKTADKMGGAKSAFVFPSTTINIFLDQKIAVHKKR